ncbi:SURF1 family protein [Sansalvadorimonas sp. 2012CJ34-2]|uniref:SURF1-like protein n=1 Tax=Parendozoicomonas callyspongiae TaxID=2942213 RepID=A0ABT0PBA1_9GAMM|nr:SURF1 family protein [Sansalvadorimonas sp. 2012CJ34-2]MCL6268486.1 SURF1 family protein [Sansalvadorimonas sp. 2012CJ34-2]
MYRTRILTFVLLLLPVLIGLGLWQYGRYQEKLELEEQYKLRRQKTFSISDLQAVDDPRYYKVSTSGSFDNSRTFLLDNRVLAGRVGFHVITLFESFNGELLLVDRGWVPGLPDRSRLPDIPDIEGSVIITGESWLPAGKAFLLAEDLWSSEWPKLIQSIDFERMQSSLNQPLQPWFLVLDEQQPGSFQRNFHVVNMPPSRHLGYAVQWFSMALALVLLGGYALFGTNKNKRAEQEL